jgi:NAD-dependent deacetylase
MSERNRVHPDAVAHWIAGAERVVALTGAGISTDSGIPDYRGPQGLWTRNPKAEQLSSLRHYLGDPEVRELAWQSRVASPVWSAQPNRAHHALVELERQGRLHALITQNVDELHQAAGTDPAKVIEVHGTMHRVVCWDCGEKAPMERALARVRNGEADPACRSCGGILKSDTISFGQALDPATIDRAFAAAEAADVLVCVGTSLQVYPVASVVPRAKSVGARIVIVNGQPTGMDALADAVLLGPIAELLPWICGIEP